MKFPIKLGSLLTVLFSIVALVAVAQNSEEPLIQVTQKGTAYQVMGWETNAVYNPDTYSFVYWDEPVMAKKAVLKSEMVSVSDFERPPVFDGICLTKENPEAMFECSTQKLEEHMAKQSFDYPDMAQSIGGEGLAYATFTLNKEGEISRIQVSMADPCKGCAEAAADAVSSMEGMWFPALMQGGKAVRTKMTVPVRFKMMGQ